MRVCDWRDAPAARLEPWYDAERVRWIRTLQWDPATSWREVEQARTGWGLPGLLAFDDAGAIRGLAFYILEESRLEIGGLLSDSRSASQALLDGLVSAADVAGATAIRGLLLAETDILTPALTSRAFSVASHMYLTHAITFPAAGASRQDAADARLTPGGWRDDDEVAVASLLRRAYRREDADLFAPGNAPSEWERYVHNLVAFTGCGSFNRDVSIVVRDNAAVHAVAIVTDIGDGIAHLVQLAVDPALRGNGIGRALIDRVCGELSARRYSALTLMVASSNGPARRLYDAAGFRQTAAFVAATLRRPAGRAASEPAAGTQQSIRAD